MEHEVGSSNRRVVDPGVVSLRQPDLNNANLDSFRCLNNWDCAQPDHNYSTGRWLPRDGEFTEGGEINAIEQSGSDTSTIGLITWESQELARLSQSPSRPPKARRPQLRLSSSLTTSRKRPSFGSNWMPKEQSSPINSSRPQWSTACSWCVPLMALSTSTSILHRRHRHGSVSNPRRHALVVDLQPGIVEYPTAVAIGDGVVVVSPLDESTQSTVFAVTGYARTFEANVLLIATAGGEVVDQTFTSSADYLETWGEFAADLVIPSAKCPYLSVKRARWMGRCKA